MAPVPNCTSCGNENKCYLSEPSVNALLADTSTALLAGISGSDRETIETHSYFLSDFNLEHEIIYTAYQRKYITGRKHS
jgi:hypothetical protein